jgi:hypothetical protein
VETGPPPLPRGSVSRSMIQARPALQCIFQWAFRRRHCFTSRVSLPRTRVGMWIFPFPRPPGSHPEGVCGVRPVRSEELVRLPQRADDPGQGALPSRWSTGVRQMPMLCVFLVPRRLRLSYFGRNYQGVRGIILPAICLAWTKCPSDGAFCCGIGRAEMKHCTDCIFGLRTFGRCPSITWLYLPQPRLLLQNVFPRQGCPAVQMGASGFSSLITRFFLRDSPVFPLLKKVP